jgi:hypothetical protein
MRNFLKWDPFHDFLYSKAVVEGIPYQFGILNCATGGRKRGVFGQRCLIGNLL